jgi:hypothetical protein
MVMYFGAEKAASVWRTTRIPLRVGELMFNDDSHRADQEQDV